MGLIVSVDVMMIVDYINMAGGDYITWLSKQKWMIGFWLVLYCGTKMFYNHQLKRCPFPREDHNDH